MRMKNVKLLPLYEDTACALPVTERAAGKTTLFPARTPEEETVLAVGLGARDGNRDAVRLAGGNAARLLRTLEEDCEGVLKAPAGADKEWAEDFCEGFLLGAYRFDRWRGESFVRHEVTLSLAAEDAGYAAAFERAKVTAGSVCFARDLVNETPGTLYAQTMIDRLRVRLGDTPVTVEQISGDGLRDFAGLRAVSRGGHHEPAAAVLRYCTDENAPLVALIGKGITFDMGGMNLKSGRDLSGMRMDMGGAGAVAGAMDLLARRGVKANVIGVIALTENLPGEGATLPGEVVLFADGTTVQISNTDAEGRLLLADCLLYASRAGARWAVDAATLTGNMVQALGKKVTGVFGEDEAVSALTRLAKECGETVWPMPMVEEYADVLKSDYADMKNSVAEPGPGAIYAALFLHHFAKGMEWAHLDIAGTADTHKPWSCYPAGATGAGVRLMAAFAADRAMNG